MFESLQNKNNQVLHMLLKIQHRIVALANYFRRKIIDASIYEDCLYTKIYKLLVKIDSMNGHVDGVEPISVLTMHFFISS